MPRSATAKELINKLIKFIDSYNNESFYPRFKKEFSRFRDMLILRRDELDNEKVYIKSKDSNVKIEVSWLAFALYGRLRYYDKNALLGFSYGGVEQDLRAILATEVDECTGEFEYLGTDVINHCIPTAFQEKFNKIFPRPFTLFNEDLYLNSQDRVDSRIAVALPDLLRQEKANLQSLHAEDKAIAKSERKGVVRGVLKGISENGMDNASLHRVLYYAGLEPELPKEVDSEGIDDVNRSAQQRKEVVVDCFTDFWKEKTERGEAKKVIKETADLIGNYMDESDGATLASPGKS